MVKFVWNDTKAADNIRKHRISFDTAIRAFSDPFAVSMQDRIEQGEYRWQTIGLVDGILLLLVAHTVVDHDGVETIRIISARRADPKERKRYEQND